MKKSLKTLVLLLFVMIFMFALIGCAWDEQPVDPASSFETASQSTEDTVKDLVSNDPLPKVEKSLERENIKRRIEFINQPDRVGYLYLVSDNGQLIREVQVKGKVSSLNSYLTPMEQVQWYEGVDLGESYGDVPIVVQSPDLDGTYGENAQGVFWFDSDGVYQEWNGLYFYSSERMTFTTQPLLVEAVAAE